MFIGHASILKLEDSSSIALLSPPALCSTLKPIDHGHSFREYGMRKIPLQ